MIQIQRARPLATVRCLRGAAALVAVGLLGAVPSGCSSGPTMAEWADQADGVCAEINAKVESLPDPGNDPVTFGAYITRVRELLTSEQTKLAALEGPDGGEPPAAMADYLKRQLYLIDQLDEAATAGDSARLRSVLDQSARELGPLGRDVAKATGVKKCATTGPVGGEAPATSTTTASVPAASTSTSTSKTEG
ncbi:MAG: hypothetical protein IPQ14_02485 [Candidatus Microthrix sp.]|uniref:hypothetical protein n=1 Tax=Candidatus Neomicrothrix sp. TaxID=2719034 RepID=UPI0025BCA50E|nr:hypothetical protein [Candidatus Microthrix sp.]MBL0203208.1 hypothetical protein [Candidatus Microthrix sp.]